MVDLVLFLVVFQLSELDLKLRLMAARVLRSAGISSLHRPSAELLADENMAVRKAGLEAAGGPHVRTYTYDGYDFTETVPLPLAEANEALRRLREGDLRGAAVLTLD